MASSPTPDYGSLEVFPRSRVESDSPQGIPGKPEWWAGEREDGGGVTTYSKQNDQHTERGLLLTDG